MVATSRMLSRAAALGLLGLLGLAVWQLVVAPLAMRHAQVREGIDSARATLGRLQAARLELAAGSAVAAAPADRQGEPPAMLAGTSEAVALANLQASVTAVLARHGVRPQTMRMLPPLERDSMRLAGLQLEVSTSMETMQRLLHALEAARPVLFIEQLTLEPRLQPGRDDAEPGLLRAAMQVYGVLPAPPASARE